MPLFRYDLAEAISDVFPSLKLPAYQVAVSYNGRVIGAVDVHQTGVLGLFLDNEVIQRITSGETLVTPRLRPLLGKEGSDDEHTRQELIRVELVDQPA